MNEHDHILALRSMAGELSAEEAQAFELRRREDPALDAACRQIETTSEFLSGSGYESFGVSFADRLMERLGSQERPTIDGTIAELLTRLFARIAPIALGAAVILGGYNLVTADDGLSPIEATLGLEPVDFAGGYESMLDEVSYGAYEFSDQLLETE